MKFLCNNKKIPPLTYAFFLDIRLSMFCIVCFVDHLDAVTKGLLQMHFLHSFIVSSVSLIFFANLKILLCSLGLSLQLLSLFSLTFHPWLLFDLTFGQQYYVHFIWHCVLFATIRTGCSNIVFKCGGSMGTTSHSTHSRFEYLEQLMNFLSFLHPYLCFQVHFARAYRRNHYTHTDSWFVHHPHR